MRHATFSNMVACHLLMYSIMGCIPAASSAATTGGYCHSPPDPYFTVIPVLRLAARWCNLSRTFIISPINAQLSLPYSITDWSTFLYIIPRARLISVHLVVKFIYFCNVVVIHSQLWVKLHWNQWYTSSILIL